MKTFTLFAGCLLLSLPLCASTVYTQPLGDGFFHDETGSSWDYFDSTSTSISAYYTYWGTSDTLQYNTGYLQFQLDPALVGETFLAAKLYVYLESSHYGSDSPSAGFIRHVANSSAATGNASQKLGGTETVVEIKDQSAGWLELDVTAMVQNDYDMGYTYSAFSLNPNTSGYFRDAGYNIASAESTGFGPYLAVYVPEPATCSLVLLGMSGLLLRRRR